MGDMLHHRLYIPIFMVVDVQCELVDGGPGLASVDNGVMADVVYEGGWKGEKCLEDIIDTVGVHVVIENSECGS